MAISSKDAALLFFSTTIGVSFEKTLMLGRLKMNATTSQIQALSNRYKFPFEQHDLISSEGFAESFFKLLGANQVESIDLSAYEGATIIHDMNQPIDASMHSQFSALIDGGTLEHVFNFPVAIANCMNMLKPGGHFIGVSPANSQMGHGFYQFSPELFYRVFSKENGFEVTKMLVTPTEEGAWYEVADPSHVKSRVMLANSSPLAIVVVAKKIEVKAVFQVAPQQSDYQSTWLIASSIKANKRLESESKLKFLYRKFLPAPLKIVVRNVYDLLNRRKDESSELGTYNPDHFKKFNL